MRPSRFIILLCWLSACVAAPPAVTTIATDEILSDPARLPSSGYVSTGQPDRAVLETIAGAGYVAVIDLRTANEDRGLDEAATAAELGLTYVSLPVGPPEDVSWENAAALDRILAGFDGPVLLHCASGNRVGALFALRASAAGASDEEALAIGKRAGLTRYERVVRQRLAEQD